MSRQMVICDRCGKRVSVSKIGKLAFHKAFVSQFGMSIRGECPGAGKVQALPESGAERIAREDAEFNEFGMLALIAADAYIETYANEAKHGYTFPESEIREAANVYGREPIKLSAIWSKLSREARTLILSDINAVNQTETLDPLALCEDSSRKNLQTGKPFGLCERAAKFRVTYRNANGSHSRLLCTRHAARAERFNAGQARTDAALKRETREPHYKIEALPERAKRNAPVPIIRETVEWETFAPNYAAVIAECDAWRAAHSDGSDWDRFITVPEPGDGYIVRMVRR